MRQIKKIFFIALTTMATLSLVSCKANDSPNENGLAEADTTKVDNTTAQDTTKVEHPVVVPEVAEQNLRRAMQIADSATRAHFIVERGMTMGRYYNPYTKVRSTETGSIWMYTAAIEAVNAIMHGLKALKEYGDATLYNAHFDRYAALLKKLYENADYYLGTFTLTSYTQTKQWTVYSVNRSSSKGGAVVTGVENVYDDQEWFVREMLEAYKLTGDNAYLEKAEYLTDYVLDGWDCVRDYKGDEYGGIPWGPGYVSKHSCSNGPMVSPLVWLHEIYKDREDEITYRDIEVGSKARLSHTLKKCDYYLLFAEKIYTWQKGILLNSAGVYMDNYHSCTPSSPTTEIINGVEYRKGISCRTVNGPPISYNSGSMLSAAADLYRATKNPAYLADVAALSNKSFAYFAKLGATRPDFYTFAIDGFNNWFNGVLMRAYAEVYPIHAAAATYLGAYQKNLDYAYDNFLYRGFLPANLLEGWSSSNANNKVEGMFTFAFAAEYAILARHELEK
jgi:predicted alpha-1,6-mannanase (GH76 family)